MSSKSKKKPVVRRVSIVIADEPVEALNEARADLAEAEEAARVRYERRLMLARQSNPPATELLKIEAQLDEERERAVTAAREAVAAAEQAVRDASETYVFRSPGRKKYEDLQAAHPPQDDDHDEARTITGRAETLAMWHRATFEPALVALCCVDPELTVAEATEFYDEWTDGEWAQLTDAAFAVSRGARQVDLGKALRAVSKPA